MGDPPGLGGARQTIRRRRRGRPGPALALLAVVVGAPLASALAVQAAGASSVPLGVAASSLTQEGRQLLWRVRLSAPFSPGALARDGRSLCLLIERPATALVAGQVCVAGPAGRSRVPRLLYAPVTAAGPGRARVLAATVTRPSASALTASFLPAGVGLRYRRLRWQVRSTLTAPPCAAGATALAQCVLLFPARPRLLALHTPRLVGCAPAGPSVVFAGPPHVREIALTFDDGPWYQPPPSAFLRVLEREHVPATFFEIGRQIPVYDPTGAYERRMLADGDMIGDHSWSHPDVAALAPAQQRRQLLETAAAIRRATHGFEPCLWRPPYGEISPSLVALARSLGFLTIMWDVDPRDWALPGVDEIYENVVSHAHDGAIVLQHFGGGPRYQTLAALPREIDALRREGYRLVTVPQLLGLRLIYR